MGLFDYIKCEMPLPNTAPIPDDKWMQTKFAEDPYLEKYRITSDGRLLYQQVLEVRGPDLSYPKGSAGRIAGCMSPTRWEWIEVDPPYHGDIWFGTYNPQTREDWDYRARFSAGVCTSIIVEYSAPPSSKEREG